MSRRSCSSAKQAIEANTRVADETYFQTIGIPLLAGRAFDGRDHANAPGVVIIGKTVADRVFAGRDPIGRRIKYASFDTSGDLVIGVVGDVRISGIDEARRFFIPLSSKSFYGDNS